MSDENKRVQELLSYEIMDTEPESEFDSLIELISEVCEVPVAYMSLIDDKRQWYKSQIGLEVKEAPKEAVFCNTTLKGNDPILVPDLTKDKRFKDSPFVTQDPKLRFYGGVPLTTPSGYNIGTVCLVDTKTRDLTEFQKKTLNTIAIQIMSQLELKKKNKELKRLIKDVSLHQANLVQTEKLASLGRMAGGIAHELNNPLQVLNNYMELISVKARKIDHKDEFADIVKNSKNTIFRMAKIIQTMLGFAKSRRYASIEEVTLVSIVDDTLMLLSEKIYNYGGDFKTVWEMDNQLKIFCSPVEVSQVLINLITNAIDASTVNQRPAVSLIIQLDENSDISFSVQDNGEGIPDEIIENVKEPFFTTKEVGQGTGLGLFICHQVAHRMGGSLTYTRSENQTLFSLKFPFKSPM